MGEINGAQGFFPVNYVAMPEGRTKLPIFPFGHVIFNSFWLYSIQYITEYERSVQNIDNDDEGLYEEERVSIP